MDVEAFEEGVLLKRVVEEGQTVPVNSVCAYIGEPGEAIPEAAVRTEAAVGGPPAPATTIPLREVTATTVSPVGRDVSGHLRISPRASRLAAESGVDPRTIVGTGPEGRITERDVRATVEAAAARAAAALAPIAAPVVPVPPRPAQSAPVPSSFEDGDEGRPRQMSRMRRVIAERLTLSATTVPQFTVTVAVDMTRLLSLRAELKGAGTALTVTDFIVSATAQTLVEFPDVNSRTDGVSVWPGRGVHMGLAVSLPDGLVVPVIRDADHRSLGDLHVRASELAEAARNGTITPDDMSGGTFTISNLGMFGVDEFCAIINPGESAILAVSSVVPTPVVVGDGIGIRQIMKLTLTADHRLVDGELAARFLNALRRRLQDADAFRGDLLNG
jgi:pyruvate dehydrogenase E2 component (dihydrolipoamide acetyltransferase)